MSLLDEAAARVRAEGSFTEEWAKVRTLYFHDAGLDPYPAHRRMERFRQWAESQGLVIQYEFKFGNFSADIETVTFLPCVPDNAKAIEGYSQLEACVEGHPVFQQQNFQRDTEVFAGEMSSETSAYVTV